MSPSLQQGELRVVGGGTQGELPSSRSQRKPEGTEAKTWGSPRADPTLQMP